MQLINVALNNLSISTVNMRHAKRAPDISDLLPSVRQRGVLVPLLVRPGDASGAFEIVAGRRRYYAARAVAEEKGASTTLPCAVLDEGDDADALEASLIENIHRRDPDEMTQYETFVRMIAAGKAVDDIAATFGLSERVVHQRLALGDLLPQIREAYRREEIDPDTVRHLTMATKSQQKAWLKLFREGEADVPYGYHLKQWLFGGHAIATPVALFPLNTYTGAIAADLFGEDAYFADSAQFWERQHLAIAEKRDAYLATGWSAVEVLDVGENFRSWEHVKASRKKGGRVYVEVSRRGEVQFHEGWITQKESRKRQAAKQGDDDAGEVACAVAARPEMTQAMENYVALHRHAAVRLALIAAPSVAFRLMAAHALAASGNWNVWSDSMRAKADAIRESISASPATAAFYAERQAVQELLVADDEELDLDTGKGSGERTAAVFAKLLTKDDGVVLRLAAAVMAETLAVGSAAVEAVGQHLSVDGGRHWSPDDAFWGLLREKGIINAMMAEACGETVAAANVAATGKVQKQIIRDCLEGEGGRAKVEGWLPGWLSFPARGYSKGT